MVTWGGQLSVPGERETDNSSVESVELSCLGSTDGPCSQVIPKGASGGAGEVGSRCLPCMPPAVCFPFNSTCIFSFQSTEEISETGSASGLMLARVPEFLLACVSMLPSAVFLTQPLILSVSFARTALLRAAVFVPYCSLCVTFHWFRSVCSGSSQ